MELQSRENEAFGGGSWIGRENEGARNGGEPEELTVCVRIARAEGKDSVAFGEIERCENL